MANMTKKSNFYFSRFIGPLLNQGAPYSGQGIHEFKILFPCLRKNWNNELDPLPACIGHRTHWQYATGTHSAYGTLKKTSNTDGTTVGYPANEAIFDSFDKVANCIERFERSRKLPSHIAFPTLHHDMSKLNEISNGRCLTS